MRKVAVVLLASLFLVVVAAGAMAECRLKISSTTSTDNSGLFKILNPPFEAMFNCKVDVIAVGTGKALKIGETGDSDVVFVHARAAEDKFIADGFGVNRRDVMYNDFVIVGPASDPAGIKGMTDVKKALGAIAGKKAPFVSRGDDSGTHKKELSLWKIAGIEPAGAWYIQAGQGMGAVLIMAKEKQGYAMTDRATYLAYSSGGKIDTPILCQGDSDLFNPYGIMAVNPALHAHANYPYAMAYIGWVTSVEGQKVIGSLNVGGEQLFVPVAVPAK